MTSLTRNFQNGCVVVCWQDMYDDLRRKIELEASQKSNPSHGDFAVFSNTERTNHPSIIKVYATLHFLYVTSVEVFNDMIILLKQDNSIINNIHCALLQYQILM